MNIYKNNDKSFTLIELLVVIAIIGLISTIALVSMRGVREKAKVAQAVSFADQLREATELYWIDMEFYPPDVGRGWDPGYTHPLPYNPDTGETVIPACDHCPPNWVDIVQANWKGPYIGFWPQFTPWLGKYDYNYWSATSTTRYGCEVPPGIYIGIQRDYDDLHPIPPDTERIIVDQGIDADDYINGESQMMLYQF
jgi:prepilin-type N-terminal cleavage/methylation domain-containing protein